MNEPELQIDLDALARNYELFTAASNGETGAVVKANAYGFGSYQVVDRLYECGCHSFFTTQLSDAYYISETYSGDAYLLSTGTVFSNLAAAQSLKVSPVLYSKRQLEQWARVDPGPCALFFNTGMNRLGLGLDEVNPTRLQADLDIRLVMTHLACADTPKHPLNAIQMNRFAEIRDAFPSIRTSIGNSAATLSDPSRQGDLTRPGIGLYGGNPFTEKANPTSVVGVCQAPLIASYLVRKGESIGYGAEYEAPSDLQVGVVPMGYADGIPRGSGQKFSFKYEDLSFPIIGRVSMDLVTIDLSAKASLEVGTPLELFGHNQHVDDLARLADTISYEIFTSIGPRVRRVHTPLPQTRERK